MTQLFSASLSTGYSAVQYSTIAIFSHFRLAVILSFFVSPTWGKCRKISHVGVYLNVLLMMIAGRRQRATGHRAGRELRYKKKAWDDGKNGIRNSNKLDTRPCGKLSGLDPWGFLAVALFGLIWKRAIRKFNFFSCLSAASEWVLSMYCVYVCVCVRVSSSAQRASPYFLAISIRQTNSPLGTANGCQGELESLG